MAFAKTDGFSKEAVDLAGFANALSHPARVAILQHLLAEEEAQVYELVNLLPLSQPSCSRHLKELRASGLVTGASRQNGVWYRIVPEQRKRCAAALHLLEMD